MSLFNKYQDQLNKASKTQTLYTGVNYAKVIAINPTKAKLAEILGDESRAEKFDTEYNIKENPLTNIKVRPVSVWVTDFEENVSPTLINFELADEVHKSNSSDNVKIINAYLQDSYALNPDTLLANANMSWFSDTGIRVARVGEVDYYKFISTLLKYDLQGDITFDTFVKDTKIDFDSVYSGEFSGLRALVDYANENEFVFAGLFCVKERETDEGIRHYQDFLSRSELIYRTSVSKSLSSIKDNIRTKKEDKEKDGYQLTSRLFTYDFMEFDREQCVNVAPEQTAKPKTGSWL